MFINDDNDQLESIGFGILIEFVMQVVRYFYHQKLTTQNAFVGIDEVRDMEEGTIENWVSFFHNHGRYFDQRIIGFKKEVERNFET